ncbi:MAG: hypothetical protein HOP11_06780 [Saprospiraceae bacterium]|nr:hypothetical protein [Saprospiraceae bacterium]
MNWLDSQVPNVTSEMLVDSILLDTTWQVHFPELFYPNMRNAILNDTLRLAYDSVNLVVIDNYTEQLIFVNKWDDPWSFSGSGGRATKKAILVPDPNAPHKYRFSCLQAGLTV